MDDLSHIPDRKARWRERHPERERERRDLDNEARRFKRTVNRAAGLPVDTPLTCSLLGCQKRGEVHHAHGGGFSVACRDHHQDDHNLNHDGPGSNGLNRGSGALSQGSGIIHHPRNGRTVSTEGHVVGLRRE